MEKNGYNNKADWALIETIAKVVYHDEMSVMTKADIKEIETSIEEGYAFNGGEPKGGEMDFDISSIFQVVTLGFAALQTVIAYVSWKCPNNVALQNTIKQNRGTDDGHRMETLKERDWVGEVISVQNLSIEVKSELLKHKDSINNAINEQMQTDL